MVTKTREIEDFEGKITVEEYKEEEIMDFQVEHTLIDNQDGTYDVEYMIGEEVDDVEIICQYKNPSGLYENIRGGTFKPSWKKGVNPKNNEMQGPLMAQHINNTLSDIENFITNNSREINIKNKNISDVFELLKVKESL